VVISKWRKENAPGEHRYRLLLAEAFLKQGEFINFGSGVTQKNCCNQTSQTVYWILSII
jgi:hypothetical protein